MVTNKLIDGVKAAYEGPDWVMTEVDVKVRETLCEILRASDAGTFGAKNSKKKFADVLMSLPLNVLPGNLMENKIAYIVPATGLVCLNTWADINVCVISLVHELYHHIGKHSERDMNLRADTPFKQLKTLDKSDPLYKYVLRKGEVPLEKKEENADKDNVVLEER